MGYKLFMYRPPGVSIDTRLPVFFWIHGGGFTTQSGRDSYGLAYADELFKRGCPVVLASVDYRQAPEHVFPAAFDDCVYAARRLLQWPDLADRFGFVPNQLHI